MNNTQKYTSLVDYSIKLNRSMQKFDTVFWGKPPKQMGSFAVTLKNVGDLIDNLKELQKINAEMQKMPSLDTEALKNNRSARKADDQISSIKSDLHNSYSRLKDEFFKQIEIAGKQCREVGRAIQDKDEKARFNSASRDFELMAFEAKTEKFRIPFNEKDEMARLKQDQVKREHEENEKQIDNISNFEMQDADKLEQALGSLTTILAMVPKDDLSNEVRSEVAQIKKVLPPKMVSINKENLEKLRHSSHLILDLEQISEILKTTHAFRGNDGKLRKIADRLEDLKPLIEQALRNERTNNQDIKQEQDNLQSKFDYATDAVKTYGNILGGNERLEQEQIRIDNGTHGFHKENERLEIDAKKANEEMHKIQEKPLYTQNWQESLRVEQLHERAKEDQEKIKENEKYMSEKMGERPVVTLPPEYTDMKKKLQNMSALYRMELIKSQELTSGGTSR